MNSGMLRILFRPGRNATDRGLATVLRLHHGSMFVLYFYVLIDENILNLLTVFLTMLTLK